jgi:hypothetical protein
LDCRKYVDIAAPGLDLLSQIELLMQSRRGHGAGANGARIIRGRHRSALRGPRPRAQILGEPPKFVAIRGHSDR